MAASSTYLQRYLAGEYEPVWEELTALGAAVREEPLYSDALAVARETMRRVRSNIGVLVDRLTEVGYQFSPNNSDRHPNWPEEWPDMFALPKPQVQEQLAELEHLVGVLPLSLRAWYEHVGSVNLVGSYPVEDPRDPDGFNNWTHYQRADPMEERLAEYEEWSGWLDYHDLDPLFVYPIEQALHYVKSWLRPGQSSIEIAIAPDAHFKYGFSGGGSYDITVPNCAADALLEGEWHETTFVDYLRICFRWGGFPGLHTRKRIPRKELAFLTRGLLPV